MMSTLIPLAIFVLASANLLVGWKFGVAAIHSSAVTKAENPELFAASMALSAFVALVSLGLSIRMIFPSAF